MNGYRSRKAKKMVVREGTGINPVCNIHLYLYNTILFFVAVGLCVWMYHLCQRTSTFSSFTPDTTPRPEARIPTEFNLSVVVGNCCDNQVPQLFHTQREKERGVRPAGRYFSSCPSGRLFVEGINRIQHHWGGTSKYFIFVTITAEAKQGGP